MGVKISVVIPTYNTAQFIVEALESVFAQTYKDYEIIIVDSESTDNTKEVLQPYMPNIRYICKKANGPAGARNVGIGNAEGEYIAFLDSDDSWLPQKLEKQMERFQSNPDFGLVFSETILFTDKGIIQRKDNSPFPSEGNMFYQLLESNPIATLTVIAKKECFAKEGNFDEELNGSEDYDMWLRIARNYSIGYVKEPLANHRVRQDGHNRSNINRAYETGIIAINKAVNSIEDDSFDKEKFLRKSLYKRHYNWGLSHFDTDNFQEARKQFSATIKYGYPNIRIFLYYFSTFLPPNQIKILRKAKHIFIR